MTYLIITMATSGKNGFDFRMSKKVAELTQVVHMLFTRNHEKEVSHNVSVFSQINPWGVIGFVVSMDQGIIWIIIYRTDEFGIGRHSPSGNYLKLLLFETKV